MDLEKAYAEVSEENKQLTKLKKKFFLPESINKNFIKSHLPCLKYFLIKTLKSSI